MIGCSQLPSLPTRAALSDGNFIRSRATEFSYAVVFLFRQSCWILDGLLFLVGRVLRLEVPTGLGGCGLENKVAARAKKYARELCVPIMLFAFPSTTLVPDADFMLV